MSDADEPPFGRDPTPEEKAKAAEKYPRLKHWKVTGEATESYNCIGWSLCSEDFGWVNPKRTLAEQDALYKARGFVPSATCEPEHKKRKVAVYCKDGEPVHAAKEIADGGWYESKRGNNIRIIHRRDELEGGFYGDVRKCYEKRDETANLALDPKG
jgi:hypothetical protein